MRATVGLAEKTIAPMGFPLRKRPLGGGFLGPPPIPEEIHFFLEYIQGKAYNLMAPRLYLDYKKRVLG